MSDPIEKFKEAVPKVIAMAWSDPAFESLLIANPEQAFREIGVNLPETFGLRVVKHDKADSTHWVLSESDGKSIMTLPLPPAPGGSVDGGVDAATAACSSSTCCTA